MTAGATNAQISPLSTDNQHASLYPYPSVLVIHRDITTIMAGEPGITFKSYFFETPWYSLIR